MIGLNTLLRLLPHLRNPLGALSPGVYEKLPVHSLLLSYWSETTHMSSREVCYLCGVAVYPAKTLDTLFAVNVEGRMGTFSVTITQSCRSQL